jgi:uncharacterized protein YndB with AHSA1/START domain
MTAIDVRAERRIQAPISAVWAVLEDLGRLPEWLAFAKAVEDVSAARAAVGATYTVKPHRSYEPTTRWTVTEVEDARRQVHESEMPVISGVRSTIELEDVGDAVVVRVHWRGEPSRLSSRLMRPMFQRRIQSNWEASLAALERVAASQMGAGTAGQAEDATRLGEAGGAGQAAQLGGAGEAPAPGGTPAPGAGDDRP